jgi:hypothetical protein
MNHLLKELKSELPLVATPVNVQFHVLTVEGQYLLSA